MLSHFLHHPRLQVFRIQHPKTENILPINPIHQHTNKQRSMAGLLVLLLHSSGFHLASLHQMQRLFSNISPRFYNFGVHDDAFARSARVRDHVFNDFDGNQFDIFELSRNSQVLQFL